MPISPRRAEPSPGDTDPEAPHRLATGQRHVITVPFEVSAVNGPAELRLDPAAEQPGSVLYSARTTTPAGTPALAGRIRWAVEDAVNRNPFPEADRPTPEPPRGATLTLRIPLDWAGRRVRAMAFVNRKRRDCAAVTQVLLTTPYLRYDGRELCWYNERNQVTRSWPMPGAPDWRTQIRSVAAGKWRVHAGAAGLQLSPWGTAGAGRGRIDLAGQLPSFHAAYQAAPVKPALLIASYSDELWITAGHLRQIFGLADSHLVRFLLPFNRMLRKYGINTRLRQAHLLAQVGVESKQMTDTLEDASGSAYEPHLERGRTVGNTQPGDGPRFKGRGLIQITGRGKYLEYGRYRGIDLLSGTNAMRVADDPELATDVTGWFWTYGKEKSTPGSVRFNLLADDDDIRTITLYVNGGFHAYGRRQEHLRRAKEVLGVR